MIMPPEVVGPGIAVGSQIGPVGWVIKVTPGLLDVVGVLEIIWIGVLVIEVSGTPPCVVELESMSEVIDEECEPPAVVEAELEKTIVSYGTVEKTILSVSRPVGGGMDDAVGSRVSVPGNHVIFAVGKSSPYVDDGSGVGSH